MFVVVVSQKFILNLKLKLYIFRFLKFSCKNFFHKIIQRGTGKDFVHLFS